MAVTLTPFKNVLSEAFTTVPERVPRSSTGLEFCKRMKAPPARNTATSAITIRTEFFRGCIVVVLSVIVRYVFTGALTGSPCQDKYKSFETKCSLFFLRILQVQLSVRFTLT